MKNPFVTLKNFYFDNMKLVNKFLLNQIALSIFGLMVCIPLQALGKSMGSDNPEFTGKLYTTIGSILASLFFLYLLYDNAWDEGVRDRNRVSNGRLAYRPFFGAKVALVAYIPTLVFVVPGVISAILRFFDLQFLAGVELVCQAIVMIFFGGTYVGIVFTFNTPHNIVMLIYALCLLPAIFAYMLGYRMGLNDKQLKTYIGMKPTLGVDEKSKKKK